MKKIFKCLGTLLYSTIVGYLLWLLFYWITPYIMGVGWYIFLAGGLISCIAASINGLLSLPMSFLVKDNIVAKVINVFPLLFFGYSSVRLPWEFNMSYGVLQYIIGISLTIIILTSFVVMMIAPFWVEEIQ